jgi:Restriction endonuclease
MHENELDPPLSRMNIFDVKEQWQSMAVFFDFSVRSYDAAEAEVHGIRHALTSALECFWLLMTQGAFGKLCVELLLAEKIGINQETGNINLERFDAIGQLLLKEAGGFRRSERWAFQFRNYQDNRITVEDLRKLENYLAEGSDEVDVVCLITSGDLTSIGNSVAVSNPRIRVWDRDVLNRLVHKHLHVLEQYFTTYPVAIRTLNDEVASLALDRLQEFTSKLAACSPGQSDFSDYERIGTEIWCYLFADELGEPRVQKETQDRVERRDVLFRNLRNSSFFKRISQRFDADFVIVDFKNYAEPIDGSVMKEVSQYANRALGKLIVVVSRKGSNESAAKAQRRLLEKGTVVLCVSDELMIEMISRKERGEGPADVLSDLLDNLLIAY